MKYVPLDNQPNVSRTRFESSSPSMRLDSRGFPHIAWIENKLGKIKVNYSYWDGTKWSYRGLPEVAEAVEGTFSSKNSLILSDEENPIIAYAKKENSNTSLALAEYRSGWNVNDFLVSYDVEWIGVARYGRDGEYSSSSSSSSSSKDSSSSSSSESSSSMSSSSSSSTLSSSSSSSSLNLDTNYCAEGFEDTILDGNYTETGFYNNLPVYNNGTFDLWYDIVLSVWVISVNAGDAQVFWSSRKFAVGGTPSGVYTNAPGTVYAGICESSSSSSEVESSSSSSESEGGTSSSSSSLADSSSSSSLGFSSSSSTSSSSSSSSINYSSSSSSSSSVEYSSSSSSTESSSSSSIGNSSSSSSSSIDSNSTSSSSSYDDGKSIVVVYDGTNSIIKIYSVTDNLWRLIGSIGEDIQDTNSILIDVGGKNLVVVYKDSGVKYNFFDIDSTSWAFSSFEDVNTVPGDLTDIDIGAFNLEDRGYVTIGCISTSSTISYVSNIVCSDEAEETNYRLDTYPMNLNIPSDYVLGSRSVGLSVNNNNIYQLVAGGSTKQYNGIISLDTVIWGIRELTNIKCSGDDIVADDITMRTLDGVNNIAIQSNSEDIYVLQNDAEDQFASFPSLNILTDKWVYDVTYADGSLEGSDVDDTYNCQYGNFLKDSKQALSIVESNTNSPLPPVTTTTTTTTPSGPTTTTTTTTTPAYSDLYVYSFGETAMNGCYELDYYIDNAGDISGQWTHTSGNYTLKYSNSWNDGPSNPRVDISYILDNLSDFRAYNYSEPDNGGAQWDNNLLVTVAGTYPNGATATLPSGFVQQGCP